VKYFVSKGVALKSLLIQELGQIIFPSHSLLHNLLKWSSAVK